jgi:magnesium transporter
MIPLSRLFNQAKIQQLNPLNFRSTKSVGAPPGTLTHSGLQHDFEPYIEWHYFNKDGYESIKIATLSELPDSFDAEKAHWINVVGVHQVELVRRLGEKFNINAITLEDVLNTQQRSKFESYEHYDFTVQNLPHLDEQHDQLITEQVSIISLKDVIITFQERNIDYLEPIKKRLQSGALRIRTWGVPYLHYAIIDLLIDYFFPIMERYLIVIEDLEEKILEKPTDSILSSIYQVRRDLVLIRRCIWPSRDIVNTIKNSAAILTNDDVAIFYRDTQDHISQLTESVEYYRDMTIGLTESYMNQISFRMNEVMKTLTIISTIFIPLSFFAGLYGMNFNPEVSPWNMPELNSPYGYPILLGFMFTLVIGMLYFFRRKDWI